MAFPTVFLDDTALDTSFISLPVQVIDAETVSIQAVFTGTPCSFTASVEVSTGLYSNDPEYVPPAWDTYKDSPQTITEAGSFTWDIRDTGVAWVRLRIVDNSSGANNGILYATVNKK